MAKKFADRVMETTTSTGTGDLALAGAVTGFQRFSVPLSVADTCDYAAFAVDGSGNPTGDWETGLGTYSATNTLTRTTVSESSNANAAVSFSAGTKRVQLTLTAASVAALIAGGGGGGGGTTYTSTHGTHAYWGIHVTSTNAGGYPGMAELIFADTPGGSQQAAGGTPTGPGSLYGSAANLFDGDPSTENVAAAGVPQDWSYQFTAPINIQEVRIIGRPTSTNEDPVNFAVRYSDDGSTWTTAWSIAGAADWTNGETKTFTDPGLTPV